MDSYVYLPDTVSVVVDWPPGLPPFAFIVETADLWQPDDPADFDLHFAAASEVVYDLFASEGPTACDGGCDGDFPHTLPADSPYRSAVNAWVARGRPPIGVGAKITVTDPHGLSVTHEIVSIDGGRVGWSPVDA